MKTSNKILLGFVLFAITLQTTCLVIAHNYSKVHIEKRNSLIPLKEFTLDESFSNLKITNQVRVTVRSNELSKVSIIGNKDSIEVNYNVYVKNDTCFISLKDIGKEYPQSITLDVKDLKSIIMTQNSNVFVQGEYQKLKVWNRGGRLDMNNNFKINKLTLQSSENAKNFIHHIDSLELSLDQSEAFIRNNNKTLDLKMTNSKITVQQSSPNQINIEKDNNSKVNLY
ncbi:hypothetical protein IFO69_19015 [Echinicola sp. CAU 1574]|uniref:Auto-transporter adhesin head GIN domain-containing protein n=1 Tax=Echinicola arenosa TaxID=2774144 RepID=A0ABR9AR57_9BACT|nr:hypothetical protein [Echinicola arenosa]MBD8490851.1 hypothetical protein [Echinicola arenosa]